MRASSLIVLVGFLGLTVSCAHKQPVVDEGAKDQAKVETKIEKKEIKQAENQAYTCLVGQDERVVTLDKQEKRCEVSYTKFGDIKQVAWAEATPSICEKAYDGIRSNIEGAGYQCQEGTQFKKKDDKEDKKPRETAATKTK